MFGYVRVEKGELRVREFEAYRGVYCSLCRALSKRYGLPARLILSYDATFLAVVRFSLDAEPPSFRPGRCPFNPAKRCNYCTNKDGVYDFVCAAAVLLFYYKVRDNLADEGFFRRLLMLLLLPFAAAWRKRARKRFAALDKLISDAMAQQTAVEQKGTADFDAAAHASADALGKMFAFATDDPNRALYRFGYAVGRWVYLLDAADDLKTDLKKRSFNVFVNAFSLSSPVLSDAQQTQIRETLNASVGAAIAAFEATEAHTMRPIIENILYDGMASAMTRVLEGDETDERSL